MPLGLVAVASLQLALRLKLPFGHDLWISHPAAERADGQTLVPQELLRINRPGLTAVLTAILHVGCLFCCLLLRIARKSPLIGLACVTPRLDFIAILGPHTPELPFVGPTFAARDFHKPPNLHLPTEAAITACHRDVVHFEGNRLPRKSHPMPLLTPRAIVLASLEWFHSNRGVTFAADNAWRLWQEGLIPVEVLHWPLRAAIGALVLEEFVRIGRSSARA